MTGPRTIIHRGMTIVELLVTIAIIGTIVGLLLPAVASVREAARRTTCGHHFRQIGQAVHVYEGAHRRLPANEGLAWTQRIGVYTEDGVASSVVMDGASHEEQERWLQYLSPLFRCPSAGIEGDVPHPAAHGGMNPVLFDHRLAEIADGTAHTLLVGELEPREAVPWILGPSVHDWGVGSDHADAVHLTLADGSVKRVARGVAGTRLGALVSLDAGDEFEW